MAQPLSEWVSIAEAVRLSGLSTRSLKRLQAGGRLTFRRSPGGHVRIARTAIDGLLRHSANDDSAAASSVQQRKERVELLGLEAEELRRTREIERIRQEDAEADRRRLEAERADAAARALELAEQRSLRVNELARRKEQKRQADAVQRRAEFERHWFAWGKSRISILAWLTIEQRHTAMDEVSFEIRGRGPEDAERMEEILAETIARVCAPWQFERDARARRERLLEESLWALAFATEQEKGRAAAEARSAIAALPLTATDWEIRSTLSSVVSPIVEAVRERITEEHAERRREEIQALGVLAKLVSRR